MPQNWEPSNWSETHASRVARGITRLRGARSAQWLSDRTEELGYRVSRAVIADLENGRRKYVAAHELIVIATALDAPPLELLFGYDDADDIEYVPGEMIARLTAVERFSGIDEETLRKYEETIVGVLDYAKGMHEQLTDVFTRIQNRKGESGGG